MDQTMMEALALTPEQAEKLNKMMAEMSYQRMQADKAQKLEAYRRLNKFVKKGQILFVGSSLMEMFPINELLMDFDLPYTIYNRGIGGWTTNEMLEALDTCVFPLEPKYIFINIGTNDLNRPGYCVEDLMARYEKILRAIQEKLPEAQLFLLAYYPVNGEVGMRNPVMRSTFEERTNARIDEANEGVKALAAKVGGRYLDLNAGLKDSQGRQKEEYTIEGLHMYADGYRQVLKELLPILETLE